MNLTDREILELNELCSAVVDDTLTDFQQARLAAWLRSSEEARQHYVRILGQSASLHTFAGEMQTEASDPLAIFPQKTFSWRWISALSVAAACFALTLFFLARERPDSDSASAVEYVARVTGAKEAAWARGSSSLQPGEHLHRGQRLELATGRAEITFDSGARVVLEGPASLDVDSAWDSTLRRGTLTASVPPEAIGFRISNPAVEVVDLGTEFTMIADASGAAEVLVLKGEVEAAPRDGRDLDTILLRQNESRRFAQSGVSDVSDSERKFALFNQPVSLDRFSPSINYVHWSFDEAGGATIKADRLGTPLPNFDATLDSDSADVLVAARTKGRRERALKFDGHLTAHAKFPGLSGSGTHTVAFWVKISKDAPLSDAYSMVAWSTNLTKLNSRPVHINWNRRPTEGPIGAIRTDFGGGFAMGTTTLRDGRWHYITVVFAPGDEKDTPVGVKQYVDGRLESSSIIPGATRAAAKVLTETNSLTDILWLGSRLSGGAKKDHFRGEMDELFIADRGLEPNEIVQLMRDNQPLPASGLATVP